MIHSGVNRATVYLHPNAIYRGQQVMGEGVLRLNMPNIDQLENKIREAESRMTIRPGEAFLDERWRSFRCRLPYSPLFYYD